jgi:threonine/homoserine/homoserine lactone efflux protein
MITISNPMTIVWWLGVFGAILSSTIQTVTKTTALLNSLAIIIGVVLWFFALSILLHLGKSFVNERTMKYVSVIAGIILIGFELYFGYNVVVMPI